MTEDVRPLSSNLEEQIITALRLAQKGEVIWSVPTRQDVRVLEELLRPHTTQYRIRVERFAQGMAVYRLDYGLERRWYELPSGARVGRLVPFDLDSAGRYELVYLLPHDNFVPISPAPEAKSESGKLLTPEQIRLWDFLSKKISEPSYALLVFTLMVGWEDSIFVNSLTPAVNRENFKNHYSKWVGKNDMESLSNLATLIFSNRHRLVEWSKSEVLNPQKIMELWRFYLRLARDLVSKPEEMKAIPIEWEDLLSEFYEGKTVTLSDNTRIVRSSLHEVLYVKTGQKVIPLISSETDMKTLIHLFVTPKSRE